MKQIMKSSFLGLTLTGLMMVACQKKSVIKNTEDSVNKTEQPSSNNLIAAKPIKGANASHWSDGWCRGNPNNCVILPEIVIYSNARTTLQHAIVNNSSTEVGTAFSSSDFDAINASLPSEMVTLLRSGNYYLAISNEDSVNICYIASRTNPVTASNVEFAFVLKKG